MSWLLAGMYCSLPGPRLQNPEHKHTKDSIKHESRQIITSPAKRGTYGFNKTTLSERMGAKGVVSEQEGWPGSSCTHQHCPSCRVMTCAHVCASPACDMTQTSAVARQPSVSLPGHQWCHLLLILPVWIVSSQPPVDSGSR